MHNWTELVLRIGGDRTAAPALIPQIVIKGAIGLLLGVVTILFGFGMFWVVTSFLKLDAQVPSLFQLYSSPFPPSNRNNKIVILWVILIALQLHQSLKYNFPR